ncbi:hypothetical protein CP532_2830 [Ophiocordyceps camponoti-leonardi (nom. inval.)]|nr:hypothetical protein CP532_2830 [Ophiocordyceps camponoti-leonardi (nom. inval.)]
MLVVVNNNIFSSYPSSSSSSSPPLRTTLPLLLLYGLLATTLTFTLTQAQPTAKLTARQLDLTPLNVTQLDKRTSSMAMMNAATTTITHHHHHQMSKRNLTSFMHKRNTTDNVPFLQKRGVLNVTDILRRRNATSFTFEKRHDPQQQQKRNITTITKRDDTNSTTTMDHVHNRRSPGSAPGSYPSRKSNHVVAQPSDFLVEADENDHDDDDDDQDKHQQQQPTPIGHRQLTKNMKAWELAQLRQHAREALRTSRRCRCEGDHSDPTQSLPGPLHRHRSSLQPSPSSLGVPRENILRIEK